MQETPESKVEDRNRDLDADCVQSVQEALETEDQARLNELLEPLHAADVADLLEQVGNAEREALVRLWGHEIDGETLSELDEAIREPLIESLPERVLVEAVRELDSDDVVDLVEDLGDEQQLRILDALEAEDRVDVEAALTYPEFSAGRLMQRERVTMPQNASVGEAIDYVRSHDDLPDQFYHIILLDSTEKPVDYVALGQLLSSPRNVVLSEITEDSFRTLKVTDDEEDVAYLFNHYHLISAPVVDEQDRLVGVITIDDAMGVLDEENEEDMLRLAGVNETSSLTDNVARTTKSRAIWLGVNLITAIIASLVIGMYAESIDQLVALAILMPIVASMGGNAGTQTMTVAVRAIATRELTASNALRISGREITVGAINGLIFGFLMAIIAGFWFGQPMLSVVIALAMVFTLVAAAIGGILIPIGLSKLGIDPALASGPFVTTVTDVVGFLAFLGLASMMLF